MEGFVSKLCIPRAFGVYIAFLIGCLLIYNYHTPRQSSEQIPQPRFDKSKYKHQSKKADIDPPEPMSDRSELKHHLKTAKKIVKEVSSKEREVSFSVTEINQRKRIQHFKQKCESFGYNGTLSGKMRLFRSMKYKLAWIKIPKIGSTFLTQVFRILNNVAGKDMFSKARYTFHNKKNTDYERVFYLQTMQTYTMLIMARNPFSRLFSAYIDKVFLPNKLDLSRQIYSRNVTKTKNIANGNICRFNNTFNDFLNYVFDKKIQHLLTDHYGPVLSKQNCYTFCKFLNIVLVKQESFSDDIEYALRLTGVDKREFDTIYAAMHEKNVQSTIPGIVKTIYKKMSDRNKRGQISDKCLSWPIIAERLWQSFQIQGYINENTKFPGEKFKNEKMYTDSNFLINLILSETNKHPLTHEQKVKQRTKALLDAYSTVTKTTMLKIKQSFALDFTFFDYSTDLLHVNK